jgi:hypothetical protein
MMNSVFLDLVEGVAERVEKKKLTANDAGVFLRRLVHGPALGLLVQLTPTPLDDLGLDLLRKVLPKE